VLDIVIEIEIMIEVEEEEIIMIEIEDWIMTEEDMIDLEETIQGIDTLTGDSMIETEEEISEEIDQ